MPFAVGAAADGQGAAPDLQGEAGDSLVGMVLLSSESGTCKAVTARLWCWLEPFQVNVSKTY